MAKATVQPAPLLLELTREEAEFLHQVLQNDLGVDNVIQKSIWEALHVGLGYKLQIQRSTKPDYSAIGCDIPSEWRNNDS